MLETWVWSLGWEDPLEEGKAVHFLPGESPWTEEPGGFQSMGLQRVGHDWATKHSREWRGSGGKVSFSWIVEELCVPLPKGQPFAPLSQVSHWLVLGLPQGRYNLPGGVIPVGQRLFYRLGDQRGPINGQHLEQPFPGKGTHAGHSGLTQQRIGPGICVFWLVFFNTVHHSSKCLSSKHPFDLPNTVSSACSLEKPTPGHQKDKSDAHAFWLLWLELDPTGGSLALGGVVAPGIGRMGDGNTFILIHLSNTCFQSQLMVNRTQQWILIFFPPIIFLLLTGLWPYCLQNNKLAFLC